MSLIWAAARCGWNRSLHGSLPRHGGYRRNVFGFRLSQRGNRRALDRQTAVDARGSLARDLCRNRGALCHGRRTRRDQVFLPGTTVGTNALLEGKGAKKGWLVTEGFRGIYPVGEQARPYGTAIFDVMYDKPPPLVPQSLTGEVSERVDFRGNVLRELDATALRQTVRGLAAQGVESIAVC